MIVCRTIIGKGVEEIEGTSAAHGESGVKFVDGARKALGLPEEKWYVSEDTRNFFKDVQSKNKKIYDEWQTNFKEWEKENPELAKQLSDGVNKKTPSTAEMFKVG